MEPILVEGAIWPPGNCCMCTRNVGEMVDLGVMIPGVGRLYVCVRYCIPKIVGLTAGQLVESRRCSATKRDGSPCSAEALPGHELCVSHIKQQQKEEREYALQDH